MHKGATKATIWMPTPPSTNMLYKGMKKRNKAKPYLKWIARATEALYQQRPLPRFNGQVRIKMTLGGLRANADVTNYIKAVEDRLVKNGIIVDDSKKWVKGVAIEWSDDIGKKIIIELELTDDKS